MPSQGDIDIHILLQSPGLSFLVVALISTMWGTYEMGKWERKLNLHPYLDKDIYFAIGAAPVLWTAVLYVLIFGFRYVFNKLLYQDSSFLLNNLIVVITILTVILHYQLGRRSSKFLAFLQHLIERIHLATEFQPQYIALRERSDRFHRLILIEYWFPTIVRNRLKRWRARQSGDGDGSTERDSSSVQSHVTTGGILFNVSLVLAMVCALLLNMVFIVIAYLFYLLPVVDFPRIMLFGVYVPVHITTGRIAKESLLVFLMRVSMIFFLIIAFLNWLFNYLALSK